MGYAATEEAKALLQDEKYSDAALCFADALNLGRKPALALQEIQADGNEEALVWLIDICCESALLNLNHLDNLDQARSDAWAACVFSQYGNHKPLECMKLVCVKQKDLMGELQACNQLLSLSNGELSDERERAIITSRLLEIEQELLEQSN